MPCAEDNRDSALAYCLEQSALPENLSNQTEPPLHAIKYIQGYVPEHLANDPQAHTLKRRGASLASALGDADLKPMVESLADEFPGFTKLYLEQWYDLDQDAADRDQIAPND